MSSSNRDAKRGPMKFAEDMDYWVLFIIIWLKLDHTEQRRFVNILRIKGKEKNPEPSGPQVGTSPHLRVHKPPPNVSAADHLFWRHLLIVFSLTCHQVVAAIHRFSSSLSAEQHGCRQHCCRTPSTHLHLTDNTTDSLYDNHHTLQQLTADPGRTCGWQLWLANSQRFWTFGRLNIDELTVSGDSGVSDDRWFSGFFSSLFLWVMSLKMVIYWL